MKHLLGWLLLLWLMTGVPLHAQTPAAASGAITGRVVNAEGEPLPDVTVRLFPRGGGGGGSPSAISDDEGRFSFAALTGQQYSLDAFAPGYVMQRNNVPTLRPGDTATLTLVKGGVISGRVTNALGEPAVAVSVSAQMIRTAEGRPTQGGGPTQPTDDRGVYRLYGLRAGVYLVVANPPDATGGPLSAYQRETPTYHPAAADRASAQEINVKLGEEASGIDIRYRGERGYQVSGKVTGATEPANPSQSGISVALRRVDSETAYNTATLRAGDGAVEFSFQGVPEGAYELTARRYENPLGNLAQAAPRRVQINGADVAGLTLTLAPLGSLAGRVTLAAVPANPAPESKCAPPNPPVWEEVSVAARRLEPGSGPLENALFRLNAQGEFVLRGLPAGAYLPLIGTRNDGWYLRGLTLTQPARGAAPARELELARTGLALKPGEALSGITALLAPGAAVLTGRLLPAPGGALPEQARVYLLPAEAEAEADLLRYAETLVMNPEGRFGFGRLAPGRYRLVAEALPAGAARPSPWQFTVGEQTTRARLRRLAAAQPELELKPCERVEQLELRLSVGK